MSAGSILSSVRRAESLSQTELARLSNTYQANISAFENGVNDPGYSTIEECLSSLDYSLVVMPTRVEQVSRFVLRIAEAIKSGQKAKAFRLVIQLGDNLQSVPLDVRVALCSAPAPSTGSEKYDALVAGLVEYLLKRDGLPVPAWVSEPKRKLKEPWVVDQYAVKNDALVKKTPRAFRNHNVLIKESEFASI